MKFSDRFNNKKGVLLKNTVMLYILQFSTYILSFIVVPYETRVLGPAFYGKLGAAMAIMVYFQLVIDFGFMLSSTEEVARERADKKKLSSIFTCVTFDKILLAAGSAVALYALCQIIPSWRDSLQFFFLFFIATVVNSMIPDYLYRGLERMSAITVRTVLIKVFFTIMIFVFLKTPEDILIVPILNIIGNSAALIGVYFHLFKKLDIHFCALNIKEAMSAMRRSLTFFYSRIASTAYTATNTVILDILSGGGASVGFYTSADKLITTAKSGMSPVADSLYPYMVKNRDFTLVKKVLKFLMPVIIAGTVVVFIFAEPLCTWFFGADFADTAKVLRVMLPVVVVILPSYILGFPTLGAMGLSKYANYSVVFGSCLHIFNLVVLYFTGNMNMVSLGAMVSVAETSILIFRIVVIYIHRDKLRRDVGENGGEK